MPDLTESSPWLERSIQCIAFLGVTLIGFDASPYGPSPMYIGASLLLAGLPLLYWRGLSLRLKDPLIILVILLAGWVLLRGSADLLFPFMDPAHYEAERFWYHFRASGAMALLVGLWIYAVPASALAGIGAMMAGMLVHPWHMQFWSELSAALSGQHRLYMNTFPNFLGRYTGTMFLTGILLLFYGVYFGIKGIYRRASWLVTLFSLYLVPFYLLLFISSKSRQAWVAGFMALVALIILIVRKLCSIEPENKKNIVYSVFVFVLFCVLMFLPFSNTVYSRFITQYQSLKALATFQLDEIEMSSFGKRVMMWQAASRDISEYPLRGWGPGYIRRVSKLNDFENITLTQVHNTYIQFAVSMGLIWAAIWTAFHVLLLVRATKTTNRLSWNAFIAEIGLIMSVLFLVSALVSCRLHNSDEFSMYLFGTSLLIGASFLNTYNKSQLP